MLVGGVNGGVVDKSQSGAVQAGTSIPGTDQSKTTFKQRVYKVH
jgi:hypothetical protein